MTVDPQPYEDPPTEQPLLDDLAQLAVPDDGPDTLDVPDEPDPNPGRDPRAREDDGVQDVDQEPVPTQVVAR